MGGVDVALQPVIRGAGAKARQGLFIDGLSLIQLGTFAQHLVQAQHLRTVRVLLGFTIGMVLAMDRGPGLGVLAGGQPQPEAEKVCQRRMQIQGPVGRVAMQVNGDTDDGDVGHTQGDQDQLQHGRCQQAFGEQGHAVVASKLVRKRAAAQSMAAATPLILGMSTY